MLAGDSGYVPATLAGMAPVEARARGENVVVCNC